MIEINEFDMPITVAHKLITATHEIKPSKILKMINFALHGEESDTLIVNVYRTKELREIAEHLIAYCNYGADEEGEE